MKRLAILFLPLLACRGPTNLEAEIPADTAYVALVEIDETGVVGASAIVRYTGQSLSLIGKNDGRTQLYTWTDDDMMQAGLSFAASSAPQEDLRAAVGCEASLPPPSWLGVWDQNTVRQISVDNPPKLSADWLQTACNPAWDPPLLRLDCPEAGECAPKITLDRPCRYRIDMNACGLGEAVATVAANGDICFEPNRQDCESVEDDFVPGRFECSTGRCAIEGFVENSKADLVQVERIKLVDVPPILPRPVTVAFSVRSSHLKYGYASDVLVLGDRILVTLADPSIPEPCSYAPARGQGTFQFHNVETLAKIDAKPSPPCVTIVKGDPNSTGFLAVFAADGISDWRMGRYTFDATQIAESDITLPAGAWRPSGMVVSMDEPLMYVLFELDSEPSTKVVVWLSTVDLSEQGSLELPSGANHFSTISDGSVAVVDAEDRRLLIYNATFSDEPREHQFIADVSRQQDFGEPYRGNLNNIMAVPAQGSMQGFLLDPPYSESTPLYTVGLNFEAHRAVQWPADNDLILMAGNRTLTYEGLIGFVHVPSKRYLFPLTEVGPSPVTEVARDELGGVLLLLPFSAELVRVRPGG